MDETTLTYQNAVGRNTGEVHVATGVTSAASVVVRCGLQLFRRTADGLLLYQHLGYPSETGLRPCKACWAGHEDGLPSAYYDRKRKEWLLP